MRLFVDRFETLTRIGYDMASGKTSCAFFRMLKETATRDRKVLLEITT